MCNIYVVSCGYHWFFIGWGFTTWWNKCEKISTGTHNVIMIIMFQELLAPRFWPCCQLQVIFIPKWITMMLIARRKLSVSSWISLICLVRQYENSNKNNMSLTNRTRRYPGQVRSTMGCFMACTIWIQHCWSDQWGCYLKWWGENPYILQHVFGSNDKAKFRDSVSKDIRNVKRFLWRIPTRR